MADRSRAAGPQRHLSTVAGRVERARQWRPSAVRWDGGPTGAVEDHSARDAPIAVAVNATTGRVGFLQHGLINVNGAITAHERRG